VIERAGTKQAIRLRAAELEEASKRHVSELRRAHRSFRAVVAENHLLRGAAEQAEARAAEDARRASLRLKQETAPLSRELRELRLERDVLQRGLDSMEQSVGPLRVEILSLQALATAAEERVREVTQRLLASRERERQETRTVLASLYECEGQLQAALDLAVERGRAESRARGQAKQHEAAAAAWAQELQRLHGDVSEVGSGMRAMREHLDERLNARLASSRERELELERTIHLALADKREVQRRAGMERRLLAQEVASAEQAGAHAARELALSSRRQALSAVRAAIGEGSFGGGGGVAALHGRSHRADPCRREHNDEESARAV
jgi:chromosome segregation ATPase